jgi:hypothetical protein
MSHKTQEHMHMVSRLNEYQREKQKMNRSANCCTEIHLLQIDIQSLFRHQLCMCCSLWINPLVKWTFGKTSLNICGFRTVRMRVQTHFKNY